MWRGLPWCLDILYQRSKTQRVACCGARKTNIETKLMKYDRYEWGGCFIFPWQKVTFSKIIENTMLRFKKRVKTVPLHCCDFVPLCPLQATKTIRAVTAGFVIFKLWTIVSTRMIIYIFFWQKYFRLTKTKITND